MPILAFAAESEPKPKTAEPSNVTITVVLPDTTPTPSKPEQTAPAIVKMYPTDVSEIFENGVRQIVKTYELGAAENPADIPRDTFERSGWTFTLTDIIRKETANAETREHKETVTLNTDTKELEKILTLLNPTMEFKAEDGFVGILSLDVASIEVKTAGTKTSSYEMKVTREYPHLSTNDTSLVPRTVTDNGKTYTLAGVDWKVGNYSTVDYEQIPDYYTAIATYTATGSSTKVTGYITTAEYNGTLAKLSQGKTIYTAYFLGEEIRTPLEMTDPKPTEPATAEPTTETTEEPTEDKTEPSELPTEEPTATPLPSGETANHGNVIPVIIIIALILAGGAFYFIRKKGADKE
jgi:hypothetical protein